MADWTQDPTNPALVISPDGRVAPRDALGPMDRVVVSPPAVVAPALPAAAPTGPTIPGSPQSPLNAAGVLSKLDSVTGPLNQRNQLPVAQTSTTTQSAVPQSILAPIMARGTERAGAQAEAVMTRGENAAQRGEQQAMNQATSAYGGYQQAEADRQQAAQRAEIARQSQLAAMAQKDESIDPDRYVRSMSTGQSIGTVILAALNGAFRGMSGQGGEGVVDILQRRVDQDIQAQKEQIASGRIRKGNLISYFANQGMNEDAAEKAAKAMSWAQLERLTQAENARIGAGAPRDEAAVMAEAIKAQREQANDELQLTLGTPRSSTTTVRQAPGPGPNQGDAFSKLLSARKAYEESGATPEQLATFDSANGMGGMAPGGESETARGKREAGEKRSEDQGKAAGALAGLEGFAEAAGLVRDPESGTFRQNPGDSSVGPNARQREGVVKAIPLWGRLGSNKIAAAETAATESFGRLQSGGVISPSEEVRFRDMIGGATTDEQLANAMNSIMTIIKPRLAAPDRKTSAAVPPGWR